MLLIEKNVLYRFLYQLVEFPINTHEIILLKILQYEYSLIAFCIPQSVIKQVIYRFTVIINYLCDKISGLLSLQNKNKIYYKCMLRK